MKKILNPMHGQAHAVARKCLILFVMLLTVSLSARAVEFEVGDLRYYVLSDADQSVEVCGYIGEPTDVVIPETVENNGVNYAVTSIGINAFSDCYSLASVTIPNSVTSIGGGAFCDCESLTSVTIPNSVTSIGELAFGECISLASVTIPNTVTSIEAYVFYRCESLTSVTIPNSVTSIGELAFGECISLASVTIPNSVTSIGDSAFWECKSLTSVTIPNSVTSIGESAFLGCKSLASVTIPNSVTSIGAYVFFSCESLTSVTIPNTVTSIGDLAFGECISLASVTIPNSVTNIGRSAFYCESLGTIHSLSQTPPAAYSNTFDNVPKDAEVYVPEGTIEAYSQAEGWNRFFDFREMTTSGVSELSADNEARPADVYNTQGMLVKANASQADIDTLAPGLYLIGGRKVIVK